MFVNNLTLHNFRNIEKLSLSFDNSLTIFYGENGQGKTNIVESIFLLANASSFRTNYFKEFELTKLIIIPKEIDGYYLENNKCIQCLFPCKNCINSTYFWKNF
mgnify:CR=1 FL=1